MEKRAKTVETTSFSLHIMAMAFMLCDHLWGTIVPGNDWLTCIGRIAFPIFAFLLVEGYFHTSNLKRYALRLFAFAVLSEIPFDLAMGSSAFYPVHQNIMWSLLLSLGLIHWNERAKKSGRVWKRIAVACASVLFGSVLGLAAMLDFHHAGVLIALAFYFFRGNSWLCRAAQFFLLFYICDEVIGGYTYEITLFGETVFLTRQLFALLALIPIWLYRGRKGVHNRAIQYACYAFYPVHLLVLGLIKLF